ncbi:MAG TPA: hypothetical protein VF184_06685 [Phycisphaeraceae bacterium]
MSSGLNSTVLADAHGPINATQAIPLQIETGHRTDPQLGVGGSSASLDAPSRLETTRPVAMKEIPRLLLRQAIVFIGMFPHSSRRQRYEVMESNKLNTR